MALVLTLLGAPVQDVAQAQIVRDDTLGAGRDQAIAPVPAADATSAEYLITPDLGLRPSDRPDLLLHSFRDFNLGAGDIATFSGPDSIDHIIARVTGGSRSSIDGTIRSTIRDSSLYFLNPAGILFGPNASLDVPGSFYASTATQLSLGDGALIDAHTPQPLLATAAPSEFGFLNATGTIEINGPSLQIREGDLGFAGTDVRIRGGEYVIGGFPLGDDLPGNISISATGRIDIGPIPPPGEDPFFGPTFFGDEIRLVGNELVLTATGLYGGSLVSLSGQRIESVLSSITARSPLVPSEIRFSAEEVELDRTPIQSDSGLYIDAGTRLRVSGTSGSLQANRTTVIHAPHIEVDAALIGAPDLRIEGQGLYLENEANLSARGPGASSNPTITLKLDREIVIRNGAAVRAASTFASDVRPTVTIETPQLVVEEGGFIAAGTASGSLDGKLIPTDDGGTIRIAADRVLVTTGGQIDASSLSEANGGVIDIRARESIEVAGSDSRISAITGVNGRGGEVFLRAPQIVVRDRGLVSAETTVDPRFADRVLGGLDPPSVPLGRGNAGLVSIEADAISLETEARVSSATSGNGNGGTIRLVARDSLRLSGRSEITAKSTGAGKAGNIELRAGNQLVVQDSVVATSSARSGGGDITLDARIIDIDDGTVSTDVGPGDSGNIQIRSQALLLRGDSRISASAREGTGGRISIQASALLRGASTNIDASSEFGVDGSVEVRAPAADLNASLAVLGSSYVDASDLLVKRCALREREEASSFRLGGRDGLPETPAGRPRVRYSRMLNQEDPADRGDFEAYLRLYSQEETDRTPPQRLIRTAEVLEAIGDVARARELLSLAAERAARSEAGWILALQARLWARSGVWTNAERDSAKAERTAEAHGDARLMGRLLLDRGHANADHGRAESARTLYTRALDHAKRAQDFDTVARARAALAKTESELVSALAELAALPPTHDVLFARLHTGLVLAALPEDTSRVQAGVVFVRIAEQAQDVRDVAAASYAWGELGRLYVREHRYEEASELLRRGLLAAANAGRHEAVYAWAGELGRLLRKSEDLEGAQQAYKISLRALQNLRGGGALSARTQSAFAAEFPGQALSRELVDVLLSRASLTNDGAARQSLLLAARAQLEADSRREIRDYFEDECLALEVVESIDAMPDALVLHPVLLEDRAELLVSGPTGIERIPVQAPVSRIRSEIEALRKLIEDRSTHEYRKPAARLFDWLIAPIQVRLTEADANRTLVIVANGAFAGIPFSALYDEQRGKFLIEQHAVAISPGLSMISPRALENRPHMALQAGLTQAVSDFPALPSAGAEVEEVHLLVGGKTLLDEEFVASTVRKELSTIPYEIVHIASHGQFGDDPDSTYLLTFDGRIGMSELADFVSQTRFRDKPLELLTLSACQTAAGNERATLGLAGVAVRAGARSTLASLWSVNDPATARLMRVFYSHLVANGASRAQALQMGQQTLLRDDIYKHPAYWAPFVLIGSWR